MRLQISSPRPALALLLSILLCACGGDGPSLPDDPGVNGANLPSGGRPSNPAGKYVGHFLVDGWAVDAALASYFSVCDSQMVYIDADWNLVVGDERDDLVDSVTIPLLGDGGSYAGRVVSPEGDGAELTVEVDVSFDEAVERWEATVRQSLDQDADGSPDASGQAVMRLEPRLDWTALRDEANGSFDGLVVVTRPAADPSTRPYVLVGGDGEVERRRFQVDAEGALYGQGPIPWFYESDEGPLALVTDDADDSCSELLLAPLAGDYAEMTVRTFAAPAAISDPDYQRWTQTETLSFHLYGGGLEQPDFQQDNVSFTALGGSQIDLDTDGSGGTDAPYFYFGEDLASGFTFQASLRPISNGLAVITPSPGSGGEPFEVSYGYVRVDGQGYIVMRHDTMDESGGDPTLRVDTFVLATDEQGRLTGDGLVQGFEFPQLVGSSAVSDEEWLMMDNEGLLEFGNGLDESLFDFVISRP